jgi:2-oxoglutarate ferredoxin oxidoreductase subunit alpha
LGTKNAVQWYSGDEHNEMGNINEEPINRRRMMDKRIGKLDLVAKEVPADFKVKFYGDKDAENIVVSWGSPKGAIIEAISQLKDEGLSVGFVQVRLMLPFPSDQIKMLLEGKKRIIDIEDNHNAQLAGVIAENTQIKHTHCILKYTGRPMMTTEVYGALKKILTNPDAPTQEVLMLGS